MENKIITESQLLNIDFAGNRKDCFKKLKQILYTPQFCGQKQLDLRSIIRLLFALENEITYVFEYPYVDRHYRDTFYFYHSAKFEELYRNCIRVHLFAGVSLVNFNDIINMSDADVQKYRGFFIVRPLSKFPLGRSLISPVAFKNKKILCCLMKNKVSLFGQKLEVNGFPHTAQDTETHTCAESSLWSLFEYLGNSYRQYLSLLPSQILHKLSSVANHRSLPSIGLSATEIARCLHDNGCECVIDKAVIRDSNGVIIIDKFRLFLLKIYVESGVPVYIILEDGSSIGHAVLIIGHEDKYNTVTLPNEVWKDVSYFEKQVVVIDDNKPPYQIGKLENLIPYLPDHKITTYFAPLPKHTNLDAQAAFFLCTQVFNDKKVGLNKFGDRWLTRLFLTGSHSFKYFILKKSGLHSSIKNYILFLAFPKFIWVCEIYKVDDFQQEQKNCSGLLIMDATGSKSITSILWYNVGSELISHDGIGWTGTHPIKPFRMAVYKHNLKGV